MARKKKIDRRARVNYHVIQPKTAEGKPMYAMLDGLVKEHHDELRQARIVLAWATNWKADADGHLKLGMCRKLGDPQRELIGAEFVIILHRDFWNSFDVNDDQRKALLDHELTHADLKYDKAGEPVEDEKGRKVYRIRKHDIEEFSSVVARNGTYKKQLEDFARALWRSKQGKLAFKDEKAAS